MALLIKNEIEIINYVKKHEPLHITALITFVLEKYKFASRPSANRAIRSMITRNKLIKHEKDVYIYKDN